MSVHFYRVKLASAGVIAAGLLISSEHARACSIALPAHTLSGYPEDGAVDVPTDVLPIYLGDLLGYSEDVEFELSAASGESVPLLRGTGGGAWYVEIVPESPLQPLTHYVLRSTAPATFEGTGEVNLQLEFTTGAGPLSGIPAAPVVSIEHYDLDLEAPTTCSPPRSGTCMSFPELPAQAGLFLTYYPFLSSSSSQQADFSYLTRRSTFLNMPDFTAGTQSDCLRLRYRAANGVLGEPAVSCRQHGARYAMAGSEDIACTADGITQDGQLVSTLPEPDAGPTTRAIDSPAQTAYENDTSLGRGCSMDAHSRPSWSWAALAALLLVRRRRG